MAKENVIQRIGTALMATKNIFLPVRHTNYQGAGNLAYLVNESEFFGVNSNKTLFAWANNQSSLTAYTDCAAFSTIVNRVTELCINGVPKVKNRKKEDSSSATAKAILKLLMNPNSTQNQSQFLTKAIMLLLTQGYLVILPLGADNNIIDGEKVQVPTSLLIPEAIETNLVQNFRNRITGVTIGATTIPIEKVWYIDLGKYDLVTGLPLSPTKVLEKDIDILMAALESEKKIIIERGPSGLISQEINKELGGVIPISPDEKKNLQRGFARSYGLVGEQSHIIITNAALKYQKTGFNKDELKIIESIQEGTKRIADYFGYPAELLSVVTATFNNQSQAETRAYTKCVIPLVNSIAEQLNAYLLYGSVENLCFDFSHLPELQENKKMAEDASKARVEKVLSIVQSQTSYEVKKYLLMVECGLSEETIVELLKNSTNEQQQGQQANGQTSEGA